MSNKNSDSVIALIVVIGVFLVIGGIMNACTPKCSVSGCDNEKAKDSQYCYYHDFFGTSKTYKHGGSTYSNSSTSSSSSYSGSSSYKTAESNKTTSTSTYKKNNSTSNNKKYYNSMDSYDAGYDDVYEDGDYVWDRYENDDDYRDGVEDAMEDDEDGEW